MKEQEARLTTQPQTPYAGYGGIFMPSSPEAPTHIEKIEQGHQTPAAGKKGHKPQTEEEKEKEKQKVNQQELPALQRMKALAEARRKLETIEKRRAEAPRINLDELAELIKDAAYIAKIANKQKDGAVGGSVFGQAIEIASRATACKEQLTAVYLQRGGDSIKLHNKIVQFFLEAFNKKDEQEESEALEKPDEEKTWKIPKEKRLKPQEEEVFANAAIQSREERISVAQQLLDRELTPEEQDALWRAHKIGEGPEDRGKDSRKPGVYNYTTEQVAKKARILAEAGFSPKERRMLLEAGIAGAAAPPEAFDEFDVADYTGTPLAPLAEELNNLGRAGLATENNLDDIARRVAALNGAVLPADRQAFLSQIRDFETLAAGEERREYGRDREQQEQSLTQAEVNAITEDRFDAASYAGSDPRIRAIADPVGNALTTGTPPVSNTFLLDQLRELRPLLARDDLPNDVRKDAERLFRELGRLKDEVVAKNTKAAELSSRGGLYGEIRMPEYQKRRLIDLAKRAHPNLQEGTEEQKAQALSAWLETEEMFNKYFSQADVNSSDPWGEALGDAANYEIKEFFRVLSNASESKTTVLTEIEKDRVRETTRRLRQEMELRQYLHDLSYRVNTNAGAEDIIKAASIFRTEDADIAFRKRGVTQILHIYEQAMLQVMAQNGGYLPGTAMINTPDGKYGEVEAIVIDQAKRAKEIGALPRDIADWEIRRAIALARGMGIVTARFFEIVAEHGIPKNNALNSWWANGLVKNIAFFRQVARFNAGQLQNAILGYKLEGSRGPWSTSELVQFKKMTTAEIVDNLVNEHEDERLIQMKNPMHIGSPFTQTGWRWKGDDINFASATAHLLQEDPNNPLIGIGLLIEAKRGDLAQHDDPKKHKEAHDAIHKGLELAGEITPLKLFYNLTGLRQDVLYKYYGKDAAGKYKVDSARKQYIREPEKGSIFIESEELQGDLKALALVQERLLNERIEAYQLFIEGPEWKRYKERIARGDEVPDSEKPKSPLETDARLKKLNFTSLVTSTDREEKEKQEHQAERVEKLAEHIHKEFHGKHMEKLMHNLEHKGWKVPWVLGTDDIPYAALNFSAIAGDTFKRRWDADIGPVVQTAGLYWEFIQNFSEFQSAGDIVKAMKKIHSTLSGHDANVANEAMRYLAEGVGKFYKKDWVTRLPAGIGTVTGFTSGKASYAQVAMGRGQMAWDELDLQAFLHHVHASGLVDHNQYDELKKRLGAEGHNLAWAMARTALPLSILAFIYMIIKEQVEEAKKAG